MKLSFYIFAMAALGKGLSGSDRIFIEFAKRLKIKHQVTAYVWEEGYEMCKRQGLTEDIKVLAVNFWCRRGFLICYIARIFKSIWFALTTKIDNNKETIIYSASEFWMDSLPAFILKIRFHKIKWIAAWFQTAPNPLVGFAQGARENSYKMSAFYYWFVQLPIKPLIKYFADFVLVNNDLEKKQFSELEKKGRVIVVLGAVNIKEIKEWLVKNRRRQSSGKNLAKIYDGVFQGRFHPQKGVVELIDIWKLVVRKVPNAKLAMIGDGPLMKSVKLKIKSEKLENNIKLLGYVFDGEEKYKIFSQSKIVVHPAFYDSGGMAAAEAMAFGIPCVGFNLDSYNSYYPQGMIKVEIEELEKFADAVIELIKNTTKREVIGQEAQKMVLENWSWNNRVDRLLNVLKNT